MIYILEDDAGIRDMMCYTLSSMGFESAGFSEASEFFAACEKQMPELVILDIMLPGEDGLSVLKKLRQSPSTRSLPVIMATAKGTEYDKITGLNLGADDYLAKPFGMMEMVSRVRAVLRRSTPEKPEDVLSIGGIVIKDSEHSVSANGEKVILTLKEYEMLKLFAQNPGRVFSRDHLLEKVWGLDYFGETRTVDVHIRTLRQKLGDCGSLVKTVRGVGYSLEAPER
ncbi:MAG TPA: response regulator transcription factor [Bacillota bacterium]|nr:response regulator transcription factor [Bacillota bacterium]